MAHRRPYVRVHTLYFEAANSCVSNVTVELYQGLFATPRHSAQPVYGSFRLAGAMAMNSSGRAVHGQRIRDKVFEIVESIAVDIRVANQSRRVFDTRGNAPAP